MIISLPFTRCPGAQVTLCVLGYSARLMSASRFFVSLARKAHEIPLRKYIFIYDSWNGASHLAQGKTEIMSCKD